MTDYIYITEYANLGPVQGGQYVQAPEEPPLAEQKKTLSGSSVRSDAFNAKTRVVRIHSTAICSVLFGDSTVTVDATSGRLAASATEFRAVPPGVTNLAAITNT